MKLANASRSETTLLRGLALLATMGSSFGFVATPEPADYAIGFGAVALGFVIWRNFRRAK